MTPRALPQALASACRNARQEAVAETGMLGTTFPDARPWTADKALDDGFWPA